MVALAWIKAEQAASFWIKHLLPFAHPSRRNFANEHVPELWLTKSRCRFVDVGHRQPGRHGRCNAGGTIAPCDVRRLVDERKRRRTQWGEATPACQFASPFVNVAPPSLLDALTLAWFPSIDALRSWRHAVRTLLCSPIRAVTRACLTRMCLARAAPRVQYRGTDRARGIERPRAPPRGLASDHTPKLSVPVQYTTERSTFQFYITKPTGTTQNYRYRTPHTPTIQRSKDHTAHATASRHHSLPR